jgi:hypothetical protein
MQGQYRTLDAAVPAQIFKPGPGGAQAVESFRRAVGDDPAAVGVLHDYAAASLRRFAERPDGTLDPSRFGMWSRQHRDALRAAPELAEPFANAARASETLQNFRPLNPEVTAAHVPEAFFSPGPGGFENVQQLRHLIGDDSTRAILSDYAASRLRAAAMKPDGTLDPAKFATWRRQHADALRAFPEMDARFADAARATEAIGEAAAARRATLDDYQQGMIGKVIGVTEPQDVTRVIGGVFGQKNAGETMKQLVTEAAKSPAAADGLRKAVIDYIHSKFISNTEAATTGAGALKSDQFQTFVRQNSAPLRQVLGDDGYTTLKAIAADLQQSNRSITAVKLPGQSNTAQDQAALAAQKVSLLRQILQQGGVALAGGMGGAAAGTGAGGLVFGGPIGAMIGAAGGAAMNAARNAGLASVDDLVKAAMLDPQLGRTLLMKAPVKADRGAEMRLAHHLNRVGALALYDGTQASPQGKDGRKGTGVRGSPVSLNAPDDVMHAAEVTAEPSPAQAEAGNYRKRNLAWKGLDLRIENEVGSERAGIGADGRPWSAPVSHPYGYFAGTKGADGDPLDVTVGPAPHSQRAFVVDQVDPKSGKFDETKIVIGARSPEEAASIYDSGFSDDSGPQRRGAVTELAVPALKQWIAKGDTTKPVAYKEPVGPDSDLVDRLKAKHPVTLSEMFADERSAKEIRAALAG